MIINEGIQKYCSTTVTIIFVCINRLCVCVCVFPGDDQRRGVALHCHPRPAGQHLRRLLADGLGAGGQRHRHGYCWGGTHTYAHTWHAQLLAAGVCLRLRNRMTVKVCVPVSVCLYVRVRLLFSLILFFSSTFSVQSPVNLYLPLFPSGGRPLQVSPLLAQTGLQTQLSHSRQVQGDHQIPYWLGLLRHHGVKGQTPVVWPGEDGLAPAVHWLARAGLSWICRGIPLWVFHHHHRYPHPFKWISGHNRKRWKPLAFIIQCLIKGIVWHFLSYDYLVSGWDLD